MSGAKVPPQAEEPAPPPTNEPPPANFSPGVAALVRGNGATAPEATPVPAMEGQANRPRPSMRATRLIQISLILSDLLLVGLAVRVVVKSDGPLGWMGVALCVVAMTMGAWLFWLACKLDSA